MIPQCANSEFVNVCIISLWKDLAVWKMMPLSCNFSGAQLKHTKNADNKYNRFLTNNKIEVLNFSKAKQ